MDVIILTAVLREILTVTTVWNTGETGDRSTILVTTLDALFREALLCLGQQHNRFSLPNKA